MRIWVEKNQGAKGATFSNTGYFLMENGMSHESQSIKVYIKKIDDLDLDLDSQQRESESFIFLHVACHGRRVM